MQTRQQILLAILLFIFTQSSWSEASVWQVTKGSEYLYLGGTVHLLQKSDHPLPEEYERAYQDSQLIVLETDMKAITDPAFEMQMLQAFTAQDGKTLASSLSAETYQQLEKFTRQRKIPLQKLSAFTPAGLTMVLTMQEYQRAGQKPELGVDFFFHQQALSDNKPIGALESPEDQLNSLASLNDLDGDSIVKHTLAELDNIDEFINKMKTYWRTGNLKKMDTEFLVEMSQEFPDVYQQIIVKRNNNWIKQIHQMIGTKEKELVLVGALHLVGKDGLIDQLKNNGYTIKKL